MRKRSRAASSLLIALALLLGACSQASTGGADKIIKRDAKTPGNLSGSWEGGLVYSSHETANGEYDGDIFSQAEEMGGYYCSFDLSVKGGSGSGSFSTYESYWSYGLVSNTLQCTYKDGRLSGKGSTPDYDISLKADVDRKTRLILGNVTYSGDGYEVVYALELYADGLPSGMVMIEGPPALPKLKEDIDFELYGGAWTGCFSLSNASGDINGLSEYTQYECTIDVDLDSGLASATVGGREDILTDLRVSAGDDELVLEGLFCGRSFVIGMTHYEINGGNIYGYTDTGGDFDFDIDVYRADALGPYTVSGWNDYLPGFWVMGGIDYTGARTLAYNFYDDGTVMMLYVYFAREDEDTNYWDVEYVAEGWWSVDNYLLSVSWYDVDYSVVSDIYDITAHMYTYEDAFEAPMLGDGVILYFEFMGYLDIG